MKNKAIGIDIGGTKISIVIGTSSGKILARKEIPTLTGKKTKDCVSNIIATVKELISKTKIKKKEIIGIGVGIPGPVDSRKGIIPRSPNLAGWKGIPLSKKLFKNFGLPVRMANDANAAALGESFFGAGKNSKSFVYITVSTGMGAGIVIDGKLLEGAGFVAGEIGHTHLIFNGISCSCGKKGCFEAYGSGTAIANHVKKEMKKRKTLVSSLVSPKENFNARVVGVAAKKNDKLSIESYKKAGFHLGLGIANLLNTLNPEKIIIGGGVLKSAPKIFWTEIIKSCRKHAWPEAFKTTKIVPSKLKGQVADLGTLALAFELKN